MGAKTQKAVRNKGELPGWWMRESKGIQGELQVYEVITVEGQEMGVEARNNMGQSILKDRVDTGLSAARNIPERLL